MHNLLFNLVKVLAIAKNFLKESSEFQENLKML
jgi:hypothetical protein